MATTQKAKPNYKYNITEICMTFLEGRRFYATILAKLVKIETTKIPTAGIGFNQLGKLTLYFNPDFLLNLPLEKAQAILEHEVLHVFFRHMTRHPKDDNQFQNWIKNVGCDMAINQHLKNLPTKQDMIDAFKKVFPEVPPKLLEDAGIGLIVPETYGFERDKDADFYIEQMRKKFPEPPFCPKCGMPMPQSGKKGKDKQQQQQQQSQGQQQQKQQGGGKGKQKQQSQGQQDDSGDEGDQDQQQGQGDQDQQQGQCQGQGDQQQQGQGGGGHKCPYCGQEHGQGPGELGEYLGQGQGPDSHELWDKSVDENGRITHVDQLDFDPEYETQSLVMKAIRECKDYGHLPAFVQKELEALKNVNRYNWKHELKVFVNSVLCVSKRLSQKRVNRRFTRMNYVLPGKKKARRPRLLVARDTSGSVFDDKTQEEFLNEILQIGKHSDIFLTDCDTIIHQTMKIKNRKDIKPYKGGGGTSFVPVFIEAKKLNVDGILYLTDTYGEFPNKDVAGKYYAKTIWTTVGQDKVEIPFGKHVNIVPTKE